MPLHETPDALISQDVSQDETADVLIHFTQPPVTVTLNSQFSHTLEWHSPLHVDGVTVEPGKLNLYTYPGPHAGPELALLRRLILEVSK